MPVAVRSRSRPSRCASVAQPGPGRVDVERDLAAEQVRRDPAEDDVRVGHGRLGAAPAVAERPRVGARRAGTDLERALGRHPRDRAAPGADGDDVDHRDLAGVAADRALGGERRLAVHDDRHVGGGPAAVTGQHPVEAGVGGDQRGAEGTGCRPGQHRGDRLVDHLVGGEHPAVGLHDVPRHASAPGAAHLVQPAGDAGDVRRHPRLDRGVDQRGHRALVLAVLAQHVAGQRHHRVRVLAPQHLAHPVLVGRVGVGVQEADADRVDALVAEPAGHLDRAGLVEGTDLVTAEVQPAADGAHPVGGDDAGRLDPEVGVAVAVGHALPGDLEDELVALGGDQPEVADLALEQLVGRHRGAVADRLDLGARARPAARAPCARRP